MEGETKAAQPLELYSYLTELGKKSATIDTLGSCIIELHVVTRKTYVEELGDVNKFCHVAFTLNCFSQFRYLLAKCALPSVHLKWDDALKLGTFRKTELI